MISEEENPVASEHTQISPPLRGAIVGFGGVAAKAHLPVWSEDPNFKINAVVEPASDQVRSAREMLPEAVVYPDMESLIASGDVDFVDICTPPCFHENQMLTACKAGLHAFCEKPLPTSTDGLSRLLKAADEADRVLFVVNNWKYAPLWEKTLEIVKSKEIGVIKSISLSVQRTPGSGGGISDWRKNSRIAGGGVLLDHGWHNLYLIMAVMGSYPGSISARMKFGGTDDTGSEERVDLVLKFPESEAHLYLTRQSDLRRNDGVIIGDRGVIEINDDHLLLETTAGSPPTRYDFSEPLSAGSHHPSWMKSVLKDFYNEIIDPRTRGLNFTEAWWCAHLTDLAYQSHRMAGRFFTTRNPLQNGPDALACSI